MTVPPRMPARLLEAAERPALAPDRGRTAAAPPSAGAPLPRLRSVTRAFAARAGRCPSRHPARPGTGGGRSTEWVRSAGARATAGGGARTEAPLGSDTRRASPRTSRRGAPALGACSGDAPPPRPRQAAASDSPQALAHARLRARRLASRRSCAACHASLARSRSSAVPPLRPPLRGRRGTARSISAWAGSPKSPGTISRDSPLLALSTSGGTRRRRGSTPGLTRRHRADPEGQGSRRRDRELYTGRVFRFGLG